MPARSAALIGFSIVLISAACAPKTPPALPISEVKPLVVPMPAPPGDASLFGYLQIRNFKDTLDLFGGPMVSTVAAARGFNLTEIQPGRPATLFVWDPEGATAPQAMPLVAVLPLSAQGSLATGLRAAADSVRIEPFGEGTLAAMNPVVGDRALAQREALASIANAPIAFDQLLYVNSATIADKYLPVARQGLLALEPILAVAAAQRKDAPNPKMALGMVDNFLQTFESLRAIALGLKPYDGGFEVSALVQERQGGPGGPVAAPNLAQFVPPSDLRVVWNSRDIKRIMDFYLRVYGPMLDDKPGLRGQVQGLVDEWLKASHRMDSAVGFGFGGDKGFRGQGLLRVDNAPAMMEVFRKTLRLFNEGPIHDVYKGMGIEFQIVSKLKARRLKGWPVDRYEYHLKLGPELNEPGARAIWEKLGHTTYEVARIGPYIAFATNSSLDDVVNGLFTGKGAYPMKSMAVFPAGGGIYMDMNVPAILSGFASLLPPNLAEKLPKLPPQTDLLTLFGYDSGEVGYYKLRLPGLLLAALRAAAR